MSFHHVTLTVPSLKEGREFYLAALAPLGYKEVRTLEGVVSALGPNGKPLFWIRQVKAENDQISKGVHLAFAAESRDVVDKFYDAAIKSGAKDNGGAGERNYLPGYYAAFVFDAEGNNIEVVHV